MDISVPFEFINKVRRALMPFFFPDGGSMFAGGNYFQSMGLVGPALSKLEISV